MLFDRSLLAALAALATVAVPVLVYSAHVATRPAETVEVAKPSHVWLDELAPVTLPEIVITAKRSVEFAGPREVHRGSGQG